MALLRICRSSSPNLVLVTLASAIALLYYFRASLQSAWVIAATPVVWDHSSDDFLISRAKDNFDLTFANYSQQSDTSLPEYPDLVPPVLHHIALGSAQLKTSWVDARQSCLEYHEGWDSYLWTDENAAQFVQEHFPGMKKTWDGYKFPIQRIDALRYMVLYHYGGVVLDMDLKCTRSLGPLRRFGFVAPAAHPMGFSIGMMMASRQHPFVEDLVRNLPAYDLHWFGLPYPTVMFSTGCHYASAIHTLQQNRADLRILSGPADNHNLHRLNGDVITPLFHHLGTSSWHSFDAYLIVSLGKPIFLFRIFCIGFVLSIIVMLMNWMRTRGIVGPHLLQRHNLVRRKSTSFVLESRNAWRV